MRLVSMTCPNCGAQLQVDIDRTQVYCENCGTKLLIQDDVHHIVCDNSSRACRYVLRASGGIDSVPTD